MSQASPWPTCPDAGATVVREALLSTRHSLRIYTYQITDVDIADVILDLIRERDVRVSMVLSRAIFMDSDRTASTKVVEYMRENARGTVRCLFAHLLTSSGTRI